MHKYAFPLITARAVKMFSIASVYQKTSSVYAIQLRTYYTFLYETTVSSSYINM